LFEAIDFLVSLPIFKTWTYNAVKTLYLHAPIVSYKRGTVMYDEGEEPEFMYIIKKGEFKIMKELNLYKDIEPDMKNPVHDMFRRNQCSRLVDVNLTYNLVN
jgi:hypothetical protein